MTVANHDSRPVAEATRDALQMIADGITDLGGFDVAAVSVVRDAEHLEVMAVAGSEAARADLEGTITSVDRLLAELELADDWGLLKFVPHGPGRAWHQLDRLVAPLYDGAGELRGTLSIDCPTNGRRPDAGQRRVIEKYAAAAARSLVVAVEREQLAEEVRLLSAARRVVREAARVPDVAGMIAQVEASLLEGFRARRMWVHTFDESGQSVGTIHYGHGAGFTMPAVVARLAESAGALAWFGQRVYTLGSDTTYDAEMASMSREEFDQVVDFLAEIEADSVLFVPLGAGMECLGSLVLARSADEPAWSDLETEAALEIGRDLGGLVLNARAYEREHDLVRELKALDTYKSKLIATLSHELKSPLAAMLANIELLQDHDELEPEVASVLSAVDRGAVRLVRVVEDLLLLAKVGDPHSPLIAQPVDLVTVVDEVRTLTSIAAQSRLQVIIDDDGTGACVLGAPVELEILVTNLVNNAMKYSPEHVPVTVMLRRVGDEVCLTCSDRGIGIDDTDLPRLFEEFFRSDRPEVRREAGTGLGLAIVQRIVTRHRGRVEVTSELGAGTTFRVFLPGA